MVVNITALQGSNTASGMSMNFTDARALVTLTKSNVPAEERA